MVLGRDCSGVVVAVGKEVSRVEQGDEVNASLFFLLVYISLYKVGNLT